MTITKLEILAHNFSCNFEFTRMKKSYSIVVAASIFMLLILRYGLMNCPTIPIGDSYLNNVLYSNSTNPLEWLNTSPAEQTPLEKHTTNPLEWVNTTSPAEQKPIEKHFTNPLEWLNATSPAEEEPFEKHSTDFFEWLNTTSPAVQNPENVSQVVATEKIVSSLYAQRNISHEEQQTLGTWKLLKNLTNQGQGLPNAVDAITEAGGAWNILMDSVEEHRLGFTNESSLGRMKQCPHFLSKMNGTEIDSNGYKLRVPCGLTQGSSVTVIGIPNGILGNFQIDFTREPLPGEPEPPIILHYSVRLNGDKLTEDPVIVQNSWTIAHDWGEEERCPSPTPEKSKKVDELDNCNKIVGTTGGQRIHSNVSRQSSVQDGSKPRTYFPFKQGYPFVATLRVGSEGIQMTVDGKQITSFAIRKTLESWLVSEVRVSGDLQLISVLASGLPTSEDSEHIVNLEELKSAPLSLHKQLDLFIGVFSTANNFKQRMAVRRTWMLYAPVKSGAASAVRFFVGLHKNQIVNEELWNEAQTYGDIQLMPFVDYYGLITWKTLAICIYGTEVVSAKFVMKTDDDAFVRVDEVLASLNRINVTSGLLYGLINSDSRPHRNPNSKWYISPEEWSEEKYPPWAHGPGYVVSSDIAKAVSQRYKNGSLKMFKLEDVAMGIWVADMKKEGFNVHYEKEKKVYNEGCKDGYIVAHYQGPREMLCLWQKIQEGQVAKCCGVQKT